MSQYNETEKVFRPVKTTEDKINGLQTIDGYVYFTTDSKKIYLGSNGNKIPLCEAKGFFYGTKNIEYDNNGSTPDPNVDFYFSFTNSSISEIEGKDTPEKDDLILNVDGCFYRVGSLTDEEEYMVIHTTRLTLQGTGTGGSGGGGSATNTFVVTQVAKTCYFSTKATEALIGFKGSSSDSDNYIEYVAWGFAANETELGENYTEEFNNLTVPMQKVYNIDLVKYLSKFDPYNATAITVIIRDKQGVQRSLVYKIYSVELSLTKDSPDLLALTNDSDLTFTCNLSQASLSQKKITYQFFTAGNEVPVYETYSNLQDNDNGEMSITFGEDIR